jgi:hypothetical protein
MLEADAVIGAVYQNGTVYIDDYYIDVRKFPVDDTDIQRAARHFALPQVVYVLIQAQESKDKTIS